MNFLNFVVLTQIRKKNYLQMQVCIFSRITRAYEKIGSKMLHMRPYTIDLNCGTLETIPRKLTFQIWGRSARTIIFLKIQPLKFYLG
jgi:hypothetical protein